MSGIQIQNELSFFMTINNAKLCKSGFRLKKDQQTQGSTTFVSVSIRNNGFRHSFHHLITWQEQVDRVESRHDISEFQGRTSNRKGS